MVELMRGKCKQEGCTTSEGGKCLEGFENVEECPHFQIFDTTQEENESVVAEPSDKIAPFEQESQEMVDLPEGKILEPESARYITIASPTRLIIIAGAAGSGKTTLLTGLYERFNKGSFAGYMFAGSQTLPGFEQRCHLARLESGVSKQDTERTKRWIERDFLHIKVCPEDFSASAHDLLFSDLPGERFRAIRDSVDEAKRMVILRRADHFVLLIDGEKLNDPNKRQGAYSDGDLILQSSLDSGMLGLHSRVNVLFTKWDIILKGNIEWGAKDFIKNIEVNLKRKFENRLGCLRFTPLAARSEKGELPLVYGLDALFPAWVEQGRGAVSTKPSFLNASPERQFNRFGLRRLKQFLVQE